MATIPFLAACLFATVAQSTPKTGYVYSGGYGGGMGRPHQFTAEIGPVEGLGRAVQVVGGYYYSVALRADGTVASWGNGPEGQLGLGSKKRTTEIPTTLSGLPAIKSIASGSTISFALTETGDVYGWGVNDRSQLGPYAKKVFEPVKVTGISNVASIAAGFGFVVALKNDGTVWTWGAGTSGTLGNGQTVDRATPAQVPDLYGVTQISAAGSRVFALKANGTVWAWGSNSGGTLGVSASAPAIVSSPMPVIGLSLIKQVSTNIAHTLVLRDDGMVMSWGLNDLGQLGDPSKTTTYPGTKDPSIVPGLTDVTQIGTGGSASYALDRSGNAWVFGRGDGCVPSYKVTTPTKVPGISKVISVGGGYMHPLFISNTTTPIWTSITGNGSVPPYDTPSLRVNVEGGTANDLTVNLSSDNTLAQVPPKATIPAGSSYVDVPVTCPVAVPDYTTVILRASRATGSSAAALSLVPQVLSMYVSEEAQAGDIAGLSVTLNYKAPAGGVDVMLSTDRTDMITLPASIHIAEGMASAGVQFPTKPSTTSEWVTISADLGTKHIERQMYVRANALGTMTYSSPSVPGGKPIDLKLTLAAAAPAGGTVINLLTSSMDYFTIPSSVTVPAGATEATVTIPTMGTTVPIDAVITAYVTGSYPKWKGFRIEPAMIESVTTAKPAILGGTSTKLTVTLTGVSMGETLTVTTSDPSVVVSPNLFVEAGKWKVVANVSTSTVMENKNVAIKVKLRNQAVITKLIVAAEHPAPKAVTVESSTLTGPATTTGTVELAFPALEGGTTVTLTSSDPAVLTVPGSVKVGFGNKTATFSVNAVRVQKSTSVVISATSSGVTKQVTVTVALKPKS